MCRVQEVSKTGYYDWGKRCPGVRAASNQALDEHIREVFNQHKGRYGSPRIADELNDRDIPCSENRVARAHADISFTGGSGEEIQSDDRF